MDASWNFGGPLPCVSTPFAPPLLPSRRGSVTDPVAPHSAAMPYTHQPYATAVLHTDHMCPSTVAFLERQRWQQRPLPLSLSLSLSLRRASGSSPSSTATPSPIIQSLGGCSSSERDPLSPDNCDALRSATLHASEAFAGDAWQGDVFAPTPPRSVASTPIIAAAAPVARHIALAGQCEFLSVTPITAVRHHKQNAPRNRLFFGQVRFETTGADLRGLIYATCGVVARKVEARGSGCFVVHFETSEQMERAKWLHHRVLFDHTGVWFARTAEQQGALLRHAARNNTGPDADVRLPRDAMVVEEGKFTRAERTAAARSGEAQRAAIASVALLGTSLAAGGCCCCCSTYMCARCGENLF